MIYLVIFTLAREEDLQLQHAHQFWTIRVEYAQNSKDARHQAWKTVNRDRGLKFIKRDGWRICSVGRPHEIKVASPLRAHGSISRRMSLL